MKVTLDRIAEKTGLSKSTVSKALRQSPDLKQETISRVTTVALKLGYKPTLYGKSSLAMPLDQKPPLSMLHLVFYRQNHDFIYNNPYFFALIRELHRFMQMHNGLIVESYPGTPEELNRILSSPATEAAIFLSNLQHIESETAYSMTDYAKAKPLLLLGNYIPEYAERFTSVRADNFMAGYLATRYLLQNKVDEICFLQCFYDLAIVTDRRYGYLKAMEESNRKPRILNLDGARNHSPERVAAVLELLRSSAPKVGFLCDGESTVFILDALLTEHGLRNLDRLWVVGIDGYPDFAAEDIRVATFRLNIETMARHAIEAVSRMHATGVLKAEQFLVSGEMVSNISHPSRRS